MQPRLQHAPLPQHGTGIQAQGPALRQPEGTRGSGICLGQAVEQGEWLPTSAWPAAIDSECSCVNSRSSEGRHPTATLCSPIQTTVALLSPISPSWSCPGAADPLPPFPQGPAEPQASKLSAGLALQAGRGGRGEEEGCAEPPKGRQTAAKGTNGTKGAKSLRGSSDSTFAPKHPGHLQAAVHDACESQARA